MEAVGNDPTQAYLCAGVLQTLELSIAQHLHKSFSKITRQCRLYDSNGYIRETKRCPNAPTVCDSLDQANSWSGWGISKSQPLASKASRLPLTIHPDIWYPEMVTLHRQTIISRPFFFFFFRAKFVEKYTAFDRYFLSPNFCSHSALSAVNSFHTLLDRLPLVIVIVCFSLCPHMMKTRTTPGSG